MTTCFLLHPRRLVVRWFQWGAFCPLFRLHGDRSGPTWPLAGECPSKECRDGSYFGKCGGTASNEVWMFGDEAEAAIVKVMRLREQLRPYVMEQYWGAEYIQGGCREYNARLESKKVHVLRTKLRV